jgi:uncharacterized protein with ATP-grasp and redox domains
LVPLLEEAAQVGAEAAADLVESQRKIMKTFLDCIPCLIRQALHSVRSTTEDEQVHEVIVRTALEGIAGMDFRKPPAMMAQTIHRRIREATGKRRSVCRTKATLE